ncbi:MGMT family protein [Stenotrophomonas oahuensis]|uniref:MGMT family protein n=1 Tax=Stenotrophomonas oahuensis TaxID=3003271 RepID=UPI003CCCB87B
MAARRTHGPLADSGDGAGAGRRTAGQPRTRVKPAAAAEEDTAAQARERILAVIRAIPRGQVMGYGQVAAKAGLPGRARLTARVLGMNDDPDLPWHRVLRSDGRIAMPEGSRGWREQNQRLRAEGVVMERGRVKHMPRSSADDLDAAVWGPG